MEESRIETAVATLQQDQSRLLGWMGGTTAITSTEEQRNAEDMLIHARQSLRDVEAKRKELLKPVNETRDRINALFKPLTERLEMGIFVVNKALQEYHSRQSKEAEELRLMALAEQAAKMAEAKDTGEVVEVYQAADIPEAPAKTSRAHLGTVTYREDYDVFIVDPLKVPRELCDPNMSRIRARVKSGVTDIPGVLVTKKFVTVARGAS